MGLCLLLAPVIGAGMARAADDPSVLFPDCEKTDNIEAAKVAHMAALQLFKRGEWDRAIENWRDAYKLDCKAHGVLINASSAYENKGDLESAIAMLEAYLRRAPSAPDASEVIKKLEELRTSLPLRPKPTATAVVTAAPTATVTAAPPPPPPLPPPQRPYGATPWIAVGAGAVSALVGGLLIPAGLGAISDAEDACPDRKCTTSQGELANDGNSGRTKVIAGDLLLGVGLGALAGGLVWQLAFNKPRLVKPDDSPKPETVTPVAGPGYVGITGRF